ncbi:hypothetical protein PInf_007823 [Phytophthora infestans]|nr:hypothetical protein PInf_007823 [Phytophthora infestans]
MDPDSMTTAVSGESDGPSCAACERAACVGPELEPQDTLDVVEHGLPLPDELWLSRDVVAERGLPPTVEPALPHVVERELPEDKIVSMAERGSLLSTDNDFPRVVERELSDSARVVELGLPQAVERELPRGGSLEKLMQLSRRSRIR